MYAFSKNTYLKTFFRSERIYLAEIQLGEMSNDTSRGRRNDDGDALTQKAKYYNFICCRKTRICKFTYERSGCGNNYEVERRINSIEEYAVGIGLEKLYGNFSGA